MTTRRNEDLVNNAARTAGADPLHSADARTKARGDERERLGSPLLSPIALAALGLAGTATAHVSERSKPAVQDKETGRGEGAAAHDAPAAPAAPIVASAEGLAYDTSIQLESLIARLETEAAAPRTAHNVPAVGADGSGAPQPDAIAADGQAQADTSVAEQAQAEGAAAQAEPVQLAFAGDAESPSVISDAAPMILADATPVVSPASTPVVPPTATATAGAAGSTAAGAGAAAAGLSVGGVLAAVAGVALASSVGGGGSSSAPATSTDTPVAGVVSDGLIKDADVYVDMNDNGKVDAGDVKVGTTKADGTFSGTLTDAQKAHALIAVGGTDISTGIAFKGQFTAPAGSTVITPLTTLVQAIAGTGATAAQLTEAKAQVAEALGLPTTVDLTTYNAVAGMVSGDTATATQAQAIQIQAKALMVANLIATGTAALTGAATAAGGAVTSSVAQELSTKIVSGLVDAIKTAVNSGAAVDLASTATVQQVVEAAASSATDVVALDDAVATAAANAAIKAVVAANELIDTAAGTAAATATASATVQDAAILEALTRMLQVQTVVQGTVSNTLDDGNATTAGTVATTYDDVSEVLTAANATDTSTFKLTSTVVAIDEAAFAADTTDPTVLGVTGNATTTPFNTGDLLVFKVNMSEGVLVAGGTPTIAIKVNGVDRTATYDASRSSGDSLAFTYAVQSGDTDGDVTIPAGSMTLNGATITDLAGRNAVATLANIGSGWTVDNTAPTATITTGSINATGTTTITIALSEATSDFTLSDIAVRGGTLGSLTKSASDAKIYTAVFTPTANSTETAAIQVKAGAFADAAGNASLASNSLGGAIDGTAPTVAITSEKTSLKAGETTKVTFDLSEEAAAGTFSKDDITVTGGSLSALTQSATDKTVYTATFTPAADSSAYGAISIAQGKFTDAAGNPNDLASASITVDTARPHVATVTDSVSGTANATTTGVAYTYTFNEAVTGLAADDFTVTNGTVNSVTGSGTTWTVNVTPAADVASGSIGITLKAAAVTDAAGNTSIGSTNTAQAIDTKLPTVAISDDQAGTASDTDNTVLYTFQFSEAVTGFDASDVTVTGGTKGAFTAVDGDTYTVLVTADDDSTTSLGVTAGNTGVADAAGNAMAAAATDSAQAVDTKNPTVTVSDNVTGTANATTSEVAYTYTFSEAVTGLAADDFTVTNGTVNSVTGSGTTWTVNIKPDANVASGQIGVVLKAAAVSDAAGNTSASDSNTAQAIDTVAPTASALSPTNGGQSLGLASDLKITFSEAMSKGTGNILLYKTGATDTLVETFDAAGSKVSIGGTGNTVVSINPTADLEKGAMYYVKIDAGALTDAAGNAYAGITNSTTWHFEGAGATANISAVAGDDRINATEKASPITVSGTLTAEDAVLNAFVAGDFTSAVLKPASGSSIALTNLSYNPTTKAWSAQLDAATAVDGTYSLEVTFNGTQGAAAGIVGSGAKTVVVDTVASKPAITAIADNGGVTTDRITNDTTPVLTVTAEAGGTLHLGQNGTALNSSWYSVAETSAGTYTVTVSQALAEGGYGLVAVDAAGNVSAVPTAGETATFLIDLTAPTKTISNLALSNDAGTSGDFITSVAAQTISGTLSGALASDERVLVSVDNGGTWQEASVSGTTFSLSGATLSASSTIKAKVQDAAGNDGTAASQTYTLDTSAPAAITASIATVNGQPDIVFTGKESTAAIEKSTTGTGNWSAFDGNVDIPSNQDVTYYFRQVDVAGNAGPASSAYTFYEGTTADNTKDFSSTTNTVFSLLGDGNDSIKGGSAADQLGGDAGNDTIAGGGGADSIDLGTSGADVVKLLAATDSTVAAPDSIGNFGSGDKIDLSAIFSAAGYTSAASSLSGGSATSPIVFKNAAIVDNVDASADQDGSVLVNHVLAVEVWTNTPTYFTSCKGIKFDFATSSSVLDFWMIANSGIAVPLPTDAYDSRGIAGMTNTSNFTAGTTGKLLATAYFQLSPSANSFQVGLEGLQISTDGTSWIDKELPLVATVGSAGGGNGTLSIVADSGTALGAVGDNQAHMLATFDGTNSHLKIQFDTNSSTGTTSAGSVIALDFSGDVTANLVPANITFI